MWPDNPPDSHLYKEAKVKVKQDQSNNFVFVSPYKRHDTGHLRITLWNRDCHCYWCKRETFLFSPADWANKHKRPHRSLATIDHILSRRMADSKEEHRSRANIVISCYKCNQDRNNEECKLRSATEELKAFNKKIVRARAAQMARNKELRPYKSKFESRFETNLFELAMAIKFPGSPGKDISEIITFDIDNSTVSYKPVSSFKY
jgi:hypothetical protein